MGSQFGFHLFASYPDELVWVHSFCHWLLRKGGTWVKRTLEAGRARKFFWAIFIFKQLFEIRTSGDKQLIDQEPCKVKQRFTKHVGSNFGEVGWLLHDDN
jgi:hypothetical protein